MEKNNRCRLLQKIYDQKQKPSMNTMTFQLRVQNMIKQIQLVQNERSRCQSDFEKKFPNILRLHPIVRPKQLDNVNQRVSTLRTTSRQSKQKTDFNFRKIQQSNDQIKAIDSSQKDSSNSFQYNSKLRNYNQTLMIKETTMPIKESRIDQQTQVEFNVIANLSCWSRKSSESLL